MHVSSAIRPRKTAADGRGREANEGRSAEKQRSILEAATALFIARGYGAVSMDDVAQAASVSKPTIYNHFGDKAGLFRAAILATIDDTEAGTSDMVLALAEADEPETGLRWFARRHLADLMQPELVSMRRRIIAEAERFPELASTWYDNGPAAGVATLAGVFRRLGERGILRIDDPDRAAEHFNWLVLIPLNRAMFVPQQDLSAEELDRSADGAVAAFLRAYAVQLQG